MLTSRSATRDGVGQAVVRAWCDHCRLHAPGHYPHGEVNPAERDALTDAVRLATLILALDPDDRLGCVQTRLAALGARPVFSMRSPFDGDTTPLGVLHGDAMTPLPYRGVVVGALVGVPWAPLVDYLVPMWAVEQSVPLVCALVPGDYMTRAPQPRLRWLHALSAPGRLIIVSGLP